jgi:signal transduction histidine kinase
MSMAEHSTIQSIADLLLRESEDIVRQWLARVSDRVTVDERFLFPSEDLLDHVPRLVEGIARAVSGREPISVDTPVVMKAKELGKLRFDQGFSAHQILWEYQLLGDMILHRLDRADVYPEGPHGRMVMRRLYEALSAVQRATMDEFLDHYQRTINEREDRLRGFNHALSHELRNETGAILGAARMLREGFVAESPEHRDRFVTMVIDNAERVEHLVQNLLELSRVEVDTRRHRNVLLRHAAAEAARSLRTFAQSKGVEVRISESLPDLEVNGPAVELALTNLLANGIKYSDPTAARRWVEIRPAPSSEEGRLVVHVVDNGVGVPEGDRSRLFQRFFRSSATSDIDGTGLGLYLVRSALRSVNGDVWTEFPESGETVFAFTLPARRSEDQSTPEA